MEEIHDLFAPSSGSVTAVRQWLEDMGIHGDRISQTANKQWIQADLQAGEANDLLRTQYHIYEHEISGSSYVGCDKCVVQSDLVESFPCSHGTSGIPFPRT